MTECVAGHQPSVVNLWALAHPEDCHNVSRLVEIN